MGPALTNSLASECSVHLTPNHVRFINLVGDHIDAILSSHGVAVDNAATDNQVLDNLIEVAQAEVRQFREAHEDQGFEIEKLDVMKQPRTCTPIVYCKLRGLPMLLVHVTRTYAARRVLVSPSWKAPIHGGGKLPGRVQDAVNLVTASCRGCNHLISISEVLEMWLTHGLSLSIQERRPTLSATGKPSKLSQVTREGDDSIPDVKATIGNLRCDVSGYVSDNSYETASIPYTRDDNRKRTSPAWLRRPNRHHSCQSRRQRLHDPCPVDSSPFYSRPFVEASSDHPLKLSAGPSCPTPFETLRPTTNAELLASVNAALRKDDDARGEEAQPCFTVRAVAHENFTSLSASGIRTNVPGKLENVSSKNMASPRKYNEAVAHRNGASDYHDTDTSPDAVELRGDIGNSEGMGLISANAAPVNEFDEFMVPFEEMLAAPPSLVEKVLRTGYDENWTGDEVLDDMSCD